jgi:hypothetical protein
MGSAEFSKLTVSWSLLVKQTDRYGEKAWKTVSRRSANRPLYFLFHFLVTSVNIKLKSGWNWKSFK